MPRETYVLRDGALVPKGEAMPFTAFGPMSDLPCPMVMGDTMAPVQSMADGRMYDSKSAIRAHYRRAGVVEVGNDPARLRARPKPKRDRHAIKDTVDKATARFNRGERAS